MSTQTKTNAASSSREAVLSMPPQFLQRKCGGCGQHTVAGGGCSECEKEKGLLQRSATSNEAMSNEAKGEAPPIVHEVLRSPGQPLDASTRAFFEPRFGHDFSQVRTQPAMQRSPQSTLQIGSPSDRFEQEADGVADRVVESRATGLPRESGMGSGYDFSQVRVHTDAKAAESAREVNALAYTVGRDIVFAEAQYNPHTTEGKRLLAHELQHVTQQTGALHRQHVPDTGFRYTLPSTVTRSVIEIQGVVGTTPDGVYGENTRIAVEKYQKKLKDLGFYTDTLDGKWGKNTEAAHVAFAIAPNVERRGYNCAGFAFKDYQFHDLAATKAIYATMTKLADCSDACSPFFHKFWLWEFNLKTTDLLTGASSPTLPDFHTVGGQTDHAGKGPDQVMSKNGQRPVEGPKPPLDWELKSGPAPHPVTGAPSPRFHWTITGTKLSCFCSEKLP